MPDVDPAIVRALAPAREALRTGRVVDALSALDVSGVDDPEALLLRALLLRLLDRSGVAALIEAATADGDPRRAVRAARVVGWAAGFAHTVRVTRRSTPEELRLAEHLLDRAAIAEPGLLDVLAARFELEVQLGREVEATATLEALVARAPTDVARRLRLGRLRLAHRDAEGARPHAEAAVELAPEDPEARALLADVLVALRDPAAPDAIAAALRASPGCAIDAAERFLRIGHPSDAVAVIEQADDGPQRAAWRARLALWRGEVVDVDGDLPLAAMVRGGAAVLDGRPADALVALAAAKGAPADEVLAWSSDARRRLGDLSGARRDADRARTASTDYSLAAHLVQVLAMLATPKVEDRPPDRWIWDPLVEKLVELVPSASEARTVAEAREVALAALAALGGNRSSTPTRVVDGRLVAVSTPPHARHEARHVQHLLRTRPIDEVDAAFEALHRRLPGAPNTHTYHGEVLLWVGRYAASIPRFEAAIALDPQTVWAWIGLGAARMYLGEHAAAAAVWEEGVRAVRYRGPTLDVYEAELALREGDPERAVPMLDRALASKPIRFSAWALRAIAEHERRGDARPAALIAEQMRARTPGLWLDASDEAGSTDPVAILRASLALQRGNRSSTLAAWPSRDGRMRFARWQPLLRPDVVFRG